MMSCSSNNVVASDPKVQQASSSEQRRLAGGGFRHEHQQITCGRMDAFPWITEFRAMSRLPARTGSLMKLIRFFNKNVSSSVADCYKKSSRAAKLKELVREALLLFMYYHRFEQPQDQNRAVYLEQMSDLLAVYVDLELIASKRETEPLPSRISARLVSSLCLCLENSTEHLLDTLIKVQLVNETYSDILDPVISKVIKLSSPSPKARLDGLAYVRHLLVYRLWKRLHINLAARKNIVGLALECLKPEPPSDLPAILVERGVLPSSQNNQSDKPTTKHYLCQSYDLRNACVQFIKYSRSQSVDEGASSTTTTTTTTTTNNSTSNSSSASSSRSSSECSERDPRLKKSTLTSAISSEPTPPQPCNSVNTALLTKKPSMSAETKNIPSRNKLLKLSTPDKSRLSSIPTTALASCKSKSKQLDDIVFIDLTDEEVTKIVKRKKRTRIGWLDEAKRNFHTKISSLKIHEESSSARLSSPVVVAEEEKKDEQQQQQQQQQLADDKSVEAADDKLFASPSSSKPVDVASALSNGCSVIRETGRPAAVVTPKTDIEPKVQQQQRQQKEEEVHHCHIDSSSSSVVVSEQSPMEATTAPAPPPSSKASSEVASNYYDGIDGLALLASVSAQQQSTTTTTTATANKKPELKVKPYTSLQQQQESIVDDTMDKVALQVEVCSSSSPLSEQASVKQQQDALEEQTSAEANDNANVILNGETVMLLQKSPNSNLYIINKAAIDSSKLNYNSDDETTMMMQAMSTELLLTDDIKPALKMEPGIEYPSVYPAHCVHHQLSVDCACLSCAYCTRPYFLPPPPPPTSNSDKEKAFARFKDVDSKLPLKKRLKAQRMMDFAQTENQVGLELGAVVEVVSTANKPRGAARGNKKDKTINQNVPNCFPRKPGPKKKRLTPADDEVENNVLSAAPPAAKKARRSSRRGLAAVSYVDQHEHEADCNPSARRKKKRSTR